jgi:hypothetical protein
MDKCNRFCCSEDRPVIVVLCGSLKFPEEWIKATERETLDGKIVLSVGCIGLDGCLGHDKDDKEKLDHLHKRKIDLADEVLVLNKNGYIGESTRSEVAYALYIGKPIRWLEA